MPAASAPAAAATASPTARPSLGAVVAVSTVHLDRLWYTVPDPLSRQPASASVDFAADVAAGSPRLRLDPGGREIPLVQGPGNRWTAPLELGGLAAGVYKVGVVERVAGADVLIPSDVARSEIRLSEPEYVVWTLDFEGDASGDEELANTAAIADALKVPMTILWNPRVWTTAQVSPARADAMLAWTKARAAKGDEVGLHLHMWTDYVRAAGLNPRLVPSWAGRSDGYDVPITAYPEEEQRALMAYGLRLMSEHGLPLSTSFRAGGDFGDAATLRAVVANGLTADCTAVPSGSFGRLAWPWKLPADAQPYRPSREDANAPGDLPLLEAPTIGGNTYGYTSSSIAPIARADLATLAPGGTVAASRRALTIVSHPGTIDATERAAIEALVHAFDPLRYDRDQGPVRFVTLRELAQAYGR